MFDLFRVVVLSSLMALTFTSQATHEADHRYRIFGTVQNPDGTPMVNSKVRLTGLGGRPIGETVTDKTGSYEFRLHVHNQDLGTRFWVSVKGMSEGGAITFNPSDTFTEREHRIDLPAKE